MNSADLSLFGRFPQNPTYQDYQHPPVLRFTLEQQYPQPPQPPRYPQLPPFSAILNQPESTTTRANLYPEKELAVPSTQRPAEPPIQRKATVIRPALATAQKTAETTSQRNIPILPKTLPPLRPSTTSVTSFDDLRRAETIESLKAIIAKQAKQIDEQDMHIRTLRELQKLSVEKTLQQEQELMRLRMGSQTQETADVSLLKRQLTTARSNFTRKENEYNRLYKQHVDSVYSRNDLQFENKKLKESLKEESESFKEKVKRLKKRGRDLEIKVGALEVFHNNLFSKFGDSNSDLSVTTKDQLYKAKEELAEFKKHILRSPSPEKDSSRGLKRRFEEMQTEPKEKAEEVVEEQIVKKPRPISARRFVVERENKAQEVLELID